MTVTVELRWSGFRRNYAVPVSDGRFLVPEWNALSLNGATSLVLDVDSQNPPARRIYESVGYRTYAQVRYFGLEIVKG